MRQPAFLRDRVFWISICLLALSLTVVGLFLQNRTVINEQNIQIRQLCDDRSSLDLAVVQPDLSFWEEQLASASPEQRQFLQQRVTNLRIAHEELSSTSFCDPVR